MPNSSSNKKGANGSFFIVLAELMPYSAAT